MRQELEHFMIGDSYGGNQDWFRTFMMRIGGCGAETACDSSVYFALHRGMPDICPFDAGQLTREMYVDFAHLMEKYLWPRMTGIDRLEIYTEGYGKYLHDRGVGTLTMDVLRGDEPYEAARSAVRTQIDAGFPIPTLVLRHRDPQFEDYVWHWFLINGYEIPESSEGETDAMLVKAVTYSEYQWLDLKKLWNTGYKRCGGFIIFKTVDQKK